MKCDWSQARTISPNPAGRNQSQRWQAIACSIRCIARMRWVGPVVLGNANQQLAGVREVFRCDDFEALREAALSGFGIALLPGWVVGRDIAAGSLRRLLATEVGAGGEAGGVYVLRALAEPPAKVTAFIASLRTVVGSPPIWDRVHDRAK